MPGVTTAQILSSVQLKTRLVTGAAPSLSDADILQIGTEELLSVMVPMVLGANSEYYLHRFDISISGTTTVEIPHRAIGNKLAGVYGLDSATGVAYRIPVADYDEPDSRAAPNTGYFGPVGYITGHTLTFRPTPPNVDTARLEYYARPGDLVETSAALQIASTTSTAVVADANLSTIGISTGTLFDIVSNTSPFAHLGLDLSGTVSTDTISAITTPDFVAADDWIALSGQSPIPQIPYELHPAFIERTTARVLALLGDQQGYSMAMDRAQQLEGAALRLIAPRVDNAPNRIVSDWGPRYNPSTGVWPWPVT